MSRSRSTSSPISYHRHTNQYYVTRGGNRIYLGVDKEKALEKYYMIGLGIQLPVENKEPVPTITIKKELANRFITTQQANWKNEEVTKRGYKEWLSRFLKDYPRLKAVEFTVEMFASWKLSLRKRGYSPKSINHYLSAVRAVFTFAEDTDLIPKAPKLRRVKNETLSKYGSRNKILYTQKEITKLLQHADIQLKTMIMLALNCGFGPKDIHDLEWKDIERQRITLARSKTGISQTYLMWPETIQLLDQLKKDRQAHIKKMAKRNIFHNDKGKIFVTKYWRPWKKDAVAEQFRKLCKKATVPCYGFYRLRHCASTAMSLVASPHVQRKFMRHSQLQQQVTYTHTPDREIDVAVLQAKEKLLGKKQIILDQERNPEQDQVA